MKIVRWPILSFAVLPLLLSYHPGSSDSTTTTLKITAGGGSYAYVNRGCEGQVISATDVPFGEGAVEIDRVDKPFRFGLKTGYAHYSAEVTSEGETHLPEKNIFYVNPNMGIIKRYAALDLGVLLLNDFPAIDVEEENSISYMRPSFQLRLGNLSTWYFSTGAGHNLPLLTNGYFDIGLGSVFGINRSSFWIGLAGIPYDGTLFSLKSELGFSRKFRLIIRASAGHRERAEYGLSIGTGFRF